MRLTRQAIDQLRISSFSSFSSFSNLIDQLRTGLHGSADDTFNQGDAQDGNEGLAVTLLLQPAAFARCDD